MEFKLTFAIGKWVEDRWIRPIYTVKNNKTITYQGFWRDFNPETGIPFWADFLSKHTEYERIDILGPFFTKRMKFWMWVRVLLLGEYDFFITGENKSSQLFLAKKSIGFRPSGESENNRVIRFPYWMWYLTWPGYENSPPYLRYGERLSIERLGQSINQNFGEISRDEFSSLKKGAVLLTSHFKRHRKRLYKLVSGVMPCDVFGRKSTKTSLSKKEVLASYWYNLCPENKIGTGYITEKIPEAFLTGCIPITYCRPDDLAMDFNPDAVVNLYGLSKSQARQKLEMIFNDYDEFNRLRSCPLLMRELNLNELTTFIKL